MSGTWIDQHVILIFVPPFYVPPRSFLLTVSLSCPHFKLLSRGKEYAFRRTINSSMMGLVHRHTRLPFLVPNFYKKVIRKAVKIILHRRIHFEFKQSLFRSEQYFWIQQSPSHRLISVCQSSRSVRPHSCLFFGLIQSSPEREETTWLLRKTAIISISRKISSKVRLRVCTKGLLQFSSIPHQFVWR